MTPSLSPVSYCRNTDVTTSRDKKACVQKACVQKACVQKACVQKACVQKACVQKL